MPICFGKKYSIAVLLASLLFVNPILADNKLIEVKIGLIESLSPIAPSSSDRYRLLNESALYYALGENEKRLHECGYKITTETAYFDTYNALELINDAKALENSGAWVIIGPRRSSHFITASKVLKETPMVSTMANANAIYLSNKTIFSMYPRVSNLAKTMAKEVTKSNYGSSYGTLVDVRCDACIDFAKAYRQFNTKDKEAFYLEVADDASDLNKLREYLTKHKIDYLLVPNYSVLTRHIIAETQKYKPSLKYVGADGWGENSFSFINENGIKQNAQGIAIRGGYQDSDKNDQYKVYSLDREINGSKIKAPYSVYALVDLIRILSDDLCGSSAKSKQDFAIYLDKQSEKHFLKDTPYSIYKLSNGQLIFSHYVESNEKQ